jgi:hypothetical protein
LTGGGKGGGKVKDGNVFVIGELCWIGNGGKVKSGVVNGIENASDSSGGGVGGEGIVNASASSDSDNSGWSWAVGENGIENASSMRISGEVDTDVSSTGISKASKSSVLSISLAPGAN